MNKIADIQQKQQKNNPKKRDYRLIVDSKYNLKAIMQRAYAEMKWNGHYLKTFSNALKEAWSAARIAMDEYKEEIRFRESGASRFPNKNLSLSDLYSDPCGNLAMGYVTK
ncbi:hypothetical protein [Bacteroides sp.]|uniref:hypothetical protein n=1 Tax=Bacteroides sp. TaxID=29523 RepID=UPI002625D86A|nr:hypothetical protein [Bacteroides sp.]MDD3038877.1 hypothetical protein [Bacteroides sp.]